MFVNGRQKNLGIRTYGLNQAGLPAGVVFAAADRIMIPPQRWMVVDLVAAAAAVVVEYRMSQKHLAV